MKKRIQFTNIPELKELWPLDPWSRKLIIELLRQNQLGYLYSPTTMGEPAFRLHTREEFDQAKRIVQAYEEED
jgi:hypothetical protein